MAVNGRKLRHSKSSEWNTRKKRRSSSGKFFPSRRRGEAKQRGFTIIEILVATSILVVLVGFLVVIVRSAMNGWRKSENTSQIYSQARHLFEVFQEDFRSMVPPVDSRGKEIKFLADYDPDAPFMRVRLVRSIKGEAQWWLTRNSGRQLRSEEHLDMKDDFEEAEKGLLKPTGGLMEVAYVMDPDPDSHRLYRVIRSPIGGPGSLFDDANLKEVYQRSPISDNVLYLEFRFWTPWTTSWAVPSGENNDQEAWKRSPLRYWDSTRSRLPRQIYNPQKRGFPLLDPSSEVASNSLYPEKILVILVLRDPAYSPDNISLIEKISPSDRKILLSSTAKLPRSGFAFPYVKIGSEWIRYEKIEGNQIILGRSGARGARMTEPKEHLPGQSKVEVGKTFTWTISIPSSNFNYKE